MNLLVGLPMRLFYIFFLILRFAWPLLLALLIWLIVRRRRKKQQTGGSAPAKEPEFQGPVYTVDYKDVPEPDSKEDGV